MYLGIDIGTSAIKSIIMDPSGEVVDEAQVPLSISQPGPLMSEQDPNDWWDAVQNSVFALSKYSSAVQGIGLSGQMHGAVLLNAQAKPLRPAILWNDGRSFAECEDLESRVDIPAVTGNRAMPGFTAPKLQWVRNHEPAIFAETRKVLLPKDYIRLRMTGEFASDMSDASGTLWLNVAERRWSESVLAATGIDRSYMPALFEGSDVTGVLREPIANEWGMRRVPVVGGAGDQAAGAVGAGAVSPGICTLSLGTSGVIFAPDSQYNANPSGGVHTFCHALPDRWHEMAVILSAAGSLSWLAQVCNVESVADFLKDAEATKSTNEVLFLPYLTGERTPHNNPNATGVFVGLTSHTTTADLTNAVLEGVAFALKDSYQALENANATLDSLNLIGGGAQSTYWAQLIADVLKRPLTLREDAAVGPALGVARLAQLGVEGLAIDDVCNKAPLVQILEPNGKASDKLGTRFAKFQDLYRRLVKGFF